MSSAVAVQAKGWLERASWAATESAAAAPTGARTSAAAIGRLGHA